MAPTSSATSYTAWQLRLSGDGNAHDKCHSEVLGPYMRWPAIGRRRVDVQIFRLASARCQLPLLQTLAHAAFEFSGLSNLPFPKLLQQKSSFTGLK